MTAKGELTGSGFLLSRTTVLTAKHCTTDGDGRDAQSLTVLRAVNTATTSKVEVHRHPTLDLAVLILAEPPWDDDFPPVRFGRVEQTHSGKIEGFEAIGFPLFEYDLTTKMRNTAELHGSVYRTNEAARARLLLRDPELKPGQPDASIAGTAWDGLSGAVVFCQGLAVGVLVEHHPRQGADALQVETIYAALQDGTEGPARDLLTVMGLHPGKGLPEITPEAPRRGRYAWWLAAVVVLALAVAARVGVLPPPDEVEPPPVEVVRIEDIRADLLADDFEVTVWSAQLRPDGSPSTLVAANPSATKLTREPSTGGRLLIYDQDAPGALKLAFSFEPAATNVTDPGLEPDSAHPEVFTFPLKPDQPQDIVGLGNAELLQLYDVDGEAGYEVLGALTERVTEQDLLPRPFIIAWNAEKQHYVLQPLLSSENTSEAAMAKILEPPTTMEDYNSARLLHEYAYLRPTSIRNKATTEVLEMYALHAYILKQLPPEQSYTSSPRFLELRAAYVVSAPSTGTIQKVQVVDWSLWIRPNGGQISAYPFPRTKSLDVGSSSSTRHIKRLLDRLQ